MSLNPPEPPATTDTATRKRRPGVKITKTPKGWVAKIGGKTKWLAPLHKPTLAIERYWQKRRAWEDSRQHRPAVDNNSPLGQLGDLFLNAKRAKVDAGELGHRTNRDYKWGIQSAVDYFGYDTPALAIPAGRWVEYRKALAGKLDPHSLGRAVGAVRGLSKWAVKNEYIDRPFRFGTEFNLPSQKAIRAAKRAAGDRRFSRAQVKAILALADTDMRALFLLALNGGIGNTDLAKLSLGMIDFENGCVDFERSKTGVGRTIPLWPETAKALRAALAVKRNPKDPAHSNLVFLTPKGYPLVRDKLDADGNLTSTTDSIGMRFAEIAKAAGVPRSFYDARRTFQTVAEEKSPAHVVARIMGHAARGDDMAERYRQSVPIAELVAAVNHVRVQVIVGEKTSKVSATSRTGVRRKASGKSRRGKRR